MKKTTKSHSKTRKKAIPAVLDTSKDLRSAVLILSLLGNLFVLILWIALNLTTQYDEALINFFLTR